MLAMHPSHAGGRHCAACVFHLTKHWKKTLFTEKKFILMLMWQGRAWERWCSLPTLPLGQAWQGLRRVKAGCADSSISRWWPLGRSQHVHASSSPVGRQVFPGFSVTGSGTSCTNHFFSAVEWTLVLWISSKSILWVGMKCWHKEVLLYFW